MDVDAAVDVDMDVAVYNQSATNTPLVWSAPMESALYNPRAQPAELYGSLYIPQRHIMPIAIHR